MYVFFGTHRYCPCICRVMSCHIVSCRVISCHIVSCRIIFMSCHVMPCHVISCQCCFCCLVFAERSSYWLLHSLLFFSFLSSCVLCYFADYCCAVLFFLFLNFFFLAVHEVEGGTTEFEVPYDKLVVAVGSVNK